MNIAGKFTRVSKTDYHDGIILVATLGDVYPHDLTPDQLNHIKTFYNMPNSTIEIYSDWPDTIEPAYQAAKRNYRNGFLLITASH